MTQKLNPELLLVAANMADPKTDICEWRIADGGLIRLHVDGVPQNEYFFYQENAAHAWALERALKKFGYWFGEDDNGFWAQDVLRPKMYDPSDTLLLLKCLSAQTGVPVYE